MHNNSDCKKRKWKNKNKRQTKKESKENRLYSACRGSNPRPQINLKLHTSYSYIRTKWTVFRLKGKIHHALHAAHARAPKLDDNTPQTCPTRRRQSCSEPRSPTDILYILRQTCMQYMYRYQIIFEQKTPLKKCLM